MPTGKPTRHDRAEQAAAQASLDQRFGKLMVTMRVFNVKTDEEIRKRTFNYNDLELRKWYGKNLIWAISNGYAVELVGVEADK